MENDKIEAFIRKQKVAFICSVDEDGFGCKDMWNAFMCKGAVFSKRDITYCPTKLSANPKRIITWEEAKAIFKKEYAKNREFKIAYYEKHEYRNRETMRMYDIGE